MSHSGLSLAPPMVGREPLHVRSMWCLHAGMSLQTGSLAGCCNYPLSRSSHTSLWKAKLVSWGLCTPFHFELLQHMVSSSRKEEDFVICNG